MTHSASARSLRSKLKNNHRVNGYKSVCRDTLGHTNLNDRFMQRGLCVATEPNCCLHVLWVQHVGENFPLTGPCVSQLQQ